MCDSGDSPQGPDCPGEGGQSPGGGEVSNPPTPSSSLLSTPTDGQGEERLQEPRGRAEAAALQGPPVEEELRWGVAEAGG